MKKVIGKELGSNQFIKGKKFVRYFEVTSLTCLIAIGSILNASKVKASDAPGAVMDADGDYFVDWNATFDENGNLLSEATAPVNYAVEDSSDDFVGMMDNKFTGEFDSDKDLQDEVEEARKLATRESASGTTGSTSDSSLLETIEGATKEERNEDVDINTPYSDKCLPLLEDVPMEEVDENYTGRAPMGYVGLPHEAKNYGDASNYDEVKVRAQEIFDAINELNAEYTKKYGGPVLINNVTGLEFTLDEIISIVQYVNGAYAAKSDEDAQYMNDLLIEFIVNPFLCDIYRIEDIAYKSGNSGIDGPVTEADVIEHDNILEKVKMFNLLMGDSKNGPFYKWFSDMLYALSTETDIDEATRIYDELMLAVIEVVEGNGYVINGVNYKIDDFSRVNDMLLMIDVLVAEASGNVDYNEIGYVFNVQTAGYIGTLTIYLQDVLKQFNPQCADDLVSELESRGVEYQQGVTRDQYGNPLDIRNYGSVMEMNSIAQSLYVGAYGIPYYANEYLKFYDGEYTTEGSELGVQMVNKKR